MQSHQNEQMEESTLSDWEDALHALTKFSLIDLGNAKRPIKLLLEELIIEATHAKAHIQWGVVLITRPTQRFKRFGICVDNLLYGVLECDPDYITSLSHLNLCRFLAYYCGVVIDLREHQLFVQYRANNLPSYPPRKPLTVRHQEVLLSLVRGESDLAAANQLNIELSTFYSHKRNLFSRLDVHSSEEAIMYSFVHHLLSWTDGPDLL